jgi:hypothetical protein
LAAGAALGGAGFLLSAALAVPVNPISAARTTAAKLFLKTLPGSRIVIETSIL